MAETYNILIPVDFTNASRAAVNFVKGMNSEIDLNVTLLHMVNSDSDLQQGMKKFDLFIKENEFGSISVTPKVIKGKILQDIGKIAESLDSSLIVMGTHGEKGLQKLIGSNALRVVENCSVPLIIVQESTVYKSIQTIVMTIDLEKESVQIVRHAASLASAFNARILLVGGIHEDAMLKKKVNANMIVCKNLLDKNNVNYEFHFLERKNFDDKIIAFCIEHNADLLAATYYQKTFYAFSGKFVQNLITNNLNIPLMTIDSSAVTSSSQYSFI